MLENRGMSAYALHTKSLVTDEKGVPILDDKGKKKYRLHQSVISKIKNNKSKALQLDILGVICELLDCQPADLIVYESTTQSESTTQNVARATQSASITQNASATQSDNTTQNASDNGIYFVNNTGKTILQLLDEAKVKVRQENEEQYAEKVRESPYLYKDNPESLDKFMKKSLKKPLMTRVTNVGYDEQNKKWLRKRLVSMDGTIGWLADEDLAALDPDELVRDYDKSEIVRLGDLRIYKSLKRKSASTTRKVASATQSAKHTQSASTTRKVARATQSIKHTQSASTTQSDNKELLTTAVIAKRLGLSKKSVTDYINKGILPTIQPKGKGTPHFVKESDYPAFELYYRNLTGKM